MSQRAIAADELVALDLNTAEKLPVLAELLFGAEGPALDLGAGLAYYTRRLLAHLPLAIALDTDQIALRLAGDGVSRAVGEAERMPFADASLRTVLLADVLEHCSDDQAVLQEISRVMAPDGRLVVCVPSLAWGFVDFLALLGIQNVHDQPGPEFHHTAGYTAEGLGERLERAGFDVVRVSQATPIGSKLLIDLIALAHLLVEKWGSGRDAWTWGTLLDSPPPGLQLFRRLHPLIERTRRGLAAISPNRGFEIAILARKRA